MHRLKKWPGFAAVVRESEFSNDQIMRLFGISEDDLLNFYANGAPVAYHLALRAKNNLGYCDSHFHGWNVDSGWLVAPNGRKISLKRLETIAKVQAQFSLRLVSND